MDLSFKHFFPVALEFHISKALRIRDMVDHQGHAYQQHFCIAIEEVLKLVKPIT